MLEILVTTVNPATRVGVSTFKYSIQTARIAQHGHNLIAMLNGMEANHNKIKDLGKTHED